MKTEIDLSMMRKIFIVVSLALLLSLAAARADEPSTGQKIERLERRIDEIEKKQQQSKQSWLAEKLTIGGMISGAYQYEWVSGPTSPEGQGRGAVVFQPEVRITPTEVDELFFKFGFAAGNGLNAVTAFNLSPWAADLEEDVNNINGRNRDYLLTAWYKHHFEFEPDHSLGLTGGLIDATDYIDDNAYSNDGYTQFMNVALVNAPNTILPSYDIGAALQWDYRAFGIRGVVMNVGENDDGNNFNYFGVQAMVTIGSDGGEGTYRVTYNVSSRDFLDPSGTSPERKQILIFSFDQAFGKIFGAWIRVGIEDDAAAVEYEGIYSGGIHISGNAWGRGQDNIGIGYAYVAGAEQIPDSIRSSQVAEAYVNFGLNGYVMLTLDLQYMKDRYLPAASASDADGWIAGVRATAAF